MAEGLYIYHEGHEQEHQQVMRELKEAADMIVNVNGRMKALHDGLKGAGFAGQAQGMREWATLAREATRSMNDLTEALRKNAEAARGSGKGVGGWIKDAAEAVEAGKTLTGVLGQSKGAVNTFAAFLYRAGGSLRAFSGLTKGLGASIARLGVGIRALSMASGGWGIAIQGVITVLALFGDKLSGLSGKTKEVDETTKKLRDTQREAIEEIGREVTQLNVLLNTAKNVSLSYGERSKAVDELQKQYPEYFANMDREKILNGDVKTSYDDIVKSMMERAKQTVLFVKLQKAVTEKAEAELQLNAIEHPDPNTFVYATPEQINALRETIRLRQMDIDRLNGQMQAEKDKFEWTGYYLNEDVRQEAEAVKKKQQQDAKLTEEERRRREEQKNYRQNSITSSPVDDQLLPMPKLTMIEPNLEEDIKSLNEAYQQLHETKEKLTPQQQEMLNMQQAEIQRLVWLEESYKGGTITLEGYNKQKQEIALSSTTKILEAQAKEIQKQLELNTTQEKRVELLTKLYSILGKINEIKKQNSDGEVNAEKDKQEQLKETIELVKKFGATTKEVYTEVMEIVRRRNEAANKAADEDFEKIKRNNEYEVAKIQASQMTAEQKAEAIAKIQAQEEAQAQAIDHQKRQRAQKMAIAEKSFNVSEIIGRTALAVITALTDNEIPYYLRVINAVAAGVTGSAQLANALSAPLPQYAAGTEYAAEGLAIVGEQGAEALFDKDWKFRGFTPSKASLAYMSEGAKVIPHEETKALVAMSAGIGMSTASVALLNKQTQLNFEKSIGAHGEKVVGALGRVEKALKRKTRQQNAQHRSFIENHFKKW